MAKQKADKAIQEAWKHTSIVPPVGVNTYIVAGMAPDVSLSTVFRGVTYFLGAFVICLLLLIRLYELKALKNHLDLKH